MTKGYHQTLTILDEWKVRLPRSQEDFRTAREAAVGKRLEEVAPDGTEESEKIWHAYEGVMQKIGEWTCRRPVRIAWGRRSGTWTSGLRVRSWRQGDSGLVERARGRRSGIDSVHSTEGGGRGMVSCSRAQYQDRAFKCQAYSIWANGILTRRNDVEERDGS